MTSPKKHHTIDIRRKNLMTLSLVVGALAWVAVSIIGAQLIVGFSMVGICGRDKVNDPVFNAVYSALSYIVALLLIIFVPMLLRNIFLHKLHKESSKKLPPDQRAKEIRKDLGVKGLPTWTDIGLAPVGYIAYAMTSMLFLTIFSLFPWFNSNEAQDLAFNLSLTGADRVVAFLTLVVVAPIAEELIFRGWLYSKLRYDLLRDWSEARGMILSILLTSLLFGLVHMQWNIGVDVFALSIVLCGLREITGTTYAGILLHMIKNGLAFYLLFVLGV